MRSSIWLLAIWLFGAPLAHGEAIVRQFTPQGQTADVQQVRATFSQSMVPVGSPGSPSPFDFACPIQGNSHWIDDRTWVLDVTPADWQGQTCIFYIHANLQTLSKEPITGRRMFQFELPNVSARAEIRAISIDPGNGSEISEFQTFLVSYNKSIAALVPELKCTIEGAQERSAVRIPFTEDQKRNLPQSGQVAIESVQCGSEPLPNGSKVEVRQVREKLGDVRYQFHVRDLPRAEVKCLLKDDGCVTIAPIGIKFNAKVAKTEIEKIELIDPSGHAVGHAAQLANQDRFGKWNWDVPEFVFPFASEPLTRYAIRFPDHFADQDGRVFAPGDLPISLVTASAINVSFFNAAQSSIIPATRSPSVEIYSRPGPPPRMVTELPVGMPGNASPSDSDLLEWLTAPGARLVRLDRQGKYQILPLNTIAGSRELQATELPASDGFDRSQVALEKRGLHVLQIEDAAGGQDTVSVLVTNLLVHTKVSFEGVLVWVTSSDLGEPVPEVEIRLYACNQPLAGPVVTDALGLARFARLETSASCSLGGVVAVARVKGEQSDDVGVASFSSADPISTAGWTGQYGRGWSQPTQTFQTVFDRTLFRDGETVSMRHIARVQTSDGFDVPKNLPDTVRIEAPDGSSTDLKLSWDDGNAFSQYQIPDHAKHGQYAVTLIDSHQRDWQWRHFSDASFDLEDFRLPVMTGEIHIEGDQLIDAASPILRTSLHFGNGGAAKNWQLQLHVSEDRYGSKSDNQPPPYDFKQTVTLDNAGQARVALPRLPKNFQYGLRVEGTYADPNGELKTISQFYGARKSLLSANLRTVGAAIPGKPVDVIATVFDSRRRPEVGQPVVISYSKANVEDGPSEILCHGDTDQQGHLRCSITIPKDENSHLALSLDGIDQEGHPFSAADYIYSYGQFGSRNNLFIDADRESYRSGDLAQLTIRSPLPAARALVTVEREGVLSAQVVSLSMGKNQVAIRIEPRFGPNVFVSVLALSPLAAERQAGVLNEYASGSIELAVDPENYRLRVEVHPERTKAKPGERIKVRVHVGLPDGQHPAEHAVVSFAAVDTALLRLRDNTSWAVFEKMLQRRLNSVQTASDLTQLATPEIARLFDAAKVQAAAATQGDLYRLRRADTAMPSPVQNMSLNEIRDGGALGARTRSDFKSLLLWQAHVPLDKNGDAVIEVPLNDSVTRFRLVAIATSEANQFGTGSADIDVTQDLEITSRLPPEIREGDQFEASIAVRNASSQRLDVTVNGSAGEIRGLAPRRIQLAPGQTRNVSWMVRVPTAVQSVAWTFSATRIDHPTWGDRIEISQQVDPAIPVTVQAATFDQVSEHLNIPFAAPAEALAGSARVLVSFRASLAEPMDGVDRWLATYPYSCLEQQVSIAIGMADDRRWDVVMEKLQNYLDDDGLAKYYPSPNPHDGSEVLTAYILSVASESGRPILGGISYRMTNALSRILSGSLVRELFPWERDTTARRLILAAALARYNALHASDVAEFVPNPEWTSAMLIDYLTVLKRVKDVPDRDQKIAVVSNELRGHLNFIGRRMVLSNEERDYAWWFMNNGDVDSAKLILAVADRSDWHEDLPRLVTGLIGRQEKGAWRTTVSNAWARLAVLAVAQQFDSEPVSGVTQVKLGDQQKTVSWPVNTAESVSFNLSAKTEALDLSQMGTGKPWVTAEALAALPLHAPQFAGIEVSKTLTAVEQASPGRFTVGDVWRVRLRFTPNATMTWVALDDPVPPGATLLGSGLGGDSLGATKGERSEGRYPAFQERKFTSFKSYYNEVQRGQPVTVEYTMRLNTPGHYALPPSRVEAMYAPEMFGAVPNASIEIVAK